MTAPDRVDLRSQAYDLARLDLGLTFAPSDRPHRAYVRQLICELDAGQHLPFPDLVCEVVQAFRLRVAGLAAVDAVVEALSTAAA